MIYLGYIAIALIQLSYVPQVYKTWTSGSKGLSIYFLLSLWLGLVLLQIYSYSIGDMVYIVSNWVGIINTTSLLIMYGFNSWVGTWEENCWTKKELDTADKEAKIIGKQLSGDYK